MSNTTNTKAIMVPKRKFLLRLLCSTTMGFVALSACGGGNKPKGTPRPYADPSVESLLSKLAAKESKATSFVAESRMEYWADGERIKPTVLVMGQRGAKVRFNALNPAGDDVAADMACNGADFQYIDFTHDCQLVGQCNKRAISQLLRVSLEPDDFLLLAIGSTPIVANPSGTIHYNSSKQEETLKLRSGNGDFTQAIVLDGREGRWDVLSSTVWNASGDIEWEILNKDFAKHKSEDGIDFRLPAKTRFSQPVKKAELSIRWVERTINAELSEDKFIMEIPPELPRCGEKDS